MSLRKDYQRAFNKKIRLLNENIRTDNLWGGRFVARQKSAHFEIYNDGSSGIMYVTIRIIDKKTGYYKDYNIDFAPYLTSSDWRLWEAMNKFITEDAGVWNETPSPRDKEFVTDYLNVVIDESIMEKPYNHHLSYEFWKEVE